MGKVFVFQRDIADVVIVGHLHCVGTALAVRPAFCPIPNLHHHILGENVLAVKKVFQRPLYLIRRPCPLMEHRQNGDQHIGIVLDFIQVKMVLVIVVGAFVAVQIVLQLGLHAGIGSLRRQHFLVLGRVGGRSHCACPGVAKRHQRGRAGLHHKEQEHTGQGQQHPHGMPLHKACVFRPGLFRSGGGLFGGACRSRLCRLPRPLLILLFQAVLAPHLGNRIAGHFRVLLGGHAEVIVRRSLNILGLGPLDSLCRVLPDFLLHKPLAMPQAGLAHQLGAVGPLGADVLLLHFKNFPMYEAMDGAASGPAYPPHRAGLFGRLLFCQLILCLFQLFPALFHAELAGGGLFLLAFLAEFRPMDTLSRSTPGLRACRFIRFLLHASSPPGGW